MTEHLPGHLDAIAKSGGHLGYGINVRWSGILTIAGGRSRMFGARSADVEGFALGPNADVHLRGVVEHTLPQQDKPVLEAQQRRIGTAEFWSQKPVLLAGDAGAVRVRRKLQELVVQEQAQ